MIEVKLGDLIDKFPSLNALANTRMSITPSRIAVKVLTKSNEEAKAYAASKKDLAEQHGEGSELFESEMLELRETLVIFSPDIKKLKISKLKTADGSDIDIAPIHLMNLVGWLIEDDMEVGNE